jgi:hypothetical protein
VHASEASTVLADAARVAFVSARRRSVAAMPGAIGEFAPRAVCSDVERRAAVWAHDELRARGHEAWVETHWIRPQRALALAVGCALAALGGLIATGAPVPGLVIAAAGAISVLVDVAGRPGPLRLLLPRRATQVVLVAVDEGGRDEDPPIEAEGAARGDPLVAADKGEPNEDPLIDAEAAARGAPLVAADEGAPDEEPLIDAEGAARGDPLVAADERARRAGALVDLLVVARTDVPRRGLAARLERVPGGLWWLAGCAVAVAAAAGARVAGADGLALGIAQLVPTTVLLAAVAVALDAVFAPVGDGRAEDEAIDAALALHDSLVRDPPPGIAAGLLLAPPDALRAHLRRERLDPRRTALLHVRAGDIRSRHPQWLAAAAAAGLPARRRGPRGLPAALAPPADAERLARALATTL